MQKTITIALDMMSGDHGLESSVPAALKSLSKHQELNLILVGDKDKISKKTTVLVIAHRLTTVETADTIVVMEDGKIADSGSHKDLLEKDGVYTRLYKKQFKS